MSRAVTGDFGDGGGVSGAIDRGHVIGAVDGDDEVLRADVSSAVGDLCGVGEGEGVTVLEPIEISGCGVVGPVDGLLTTV